MVNKLVSNSRHFSYLVDGGAGKMAMKCFTFGVFQLRNTGGRPRRTTLPANGNRRFRVLRSHGVKSAGLWTACTHWVRFLPAVFSEMALKYTATLECSIFYPLFPSMGGHKGTFVSWEKIGRRPFSAAHGVQAGGKPGCGPALPPQAV